MTVPTLVLVLFCCCCWLHQAQAITKYNLLVVYDDPPDVSVEDYLAYVNISVDCLNSCDFPSTFGTNPEKLKASIVTEFLGLPVNQTGEARELFCDSVNLRTHFVLSLCKDTANRRMIRQIGLDSLIPIMQAQHMPWSYDKYAPAAPGDEVSNASIVDNGNQAPEASNYATMVPPSTVFLNSLIDVVPYINITKRVTVLYDNTFPRRDPTWQAMFGKVPLTFSYVKMRTNESLMLAQISDLKSRQPPIETLLLVAATRNIETYMMQAKDEIEEGRFKWFVFTTDVTAFLCHECNSVQVFWIRADVESDRSDFQRIRLLKKRQDQQELEEGIEPLRRVIGTEELTISFYLDLVTVAWEFMRQTSEQSEVYPVYGCFNQTMSQDDGNRTITLQEMLGELPEGTFGPWTPDDNKNNWYFENGLGKFTQYYYELDQKYTKVMGNWTVVDGVSSYYESLMQDVRQIHRYKVVTVVQRPFVQYVTDENGNKIWSGYCIDLMEEIKKKMSQKFEYEIFEAPDGLYGTINDREEWNGMIGSLVAGEADIALGALSVMAERENYVDFTVPYYDLVGTTILMRRPDQDTSLFEFMNVLEPPVWLCIVAAYFFTSFLLWLFDKFSPYSYTNNKEKYKDDPEKREFTFKECLWFCMTSLTPQGGGEAPKNISGRLVAATWWLFGFIIIASYTANLAAFLTVSRLETNIKSLDDLYKQYKIKYAPVKGSASETYFKRMAEIEAKFYDLWKEMSLNDSMDAKERAKLAVWDYPVSDKFTNMWRFMQDSELPESTAAGIDRVMASSNDENGEGFAYIGDATVIKYAELTNCNLYKVGNEFSRKPYAIAVQQNSPLKDAISKAILQLLNERQLERLREKWWTNNPNKADCEKQDNESEGISIKNIGGVFIVILAGIVLSIITLVFEYYYYKHKPARDANKRERNGTTTVQHRLEVTNGSALSPDLRNGSALNGHATHKQQHPFANQGATQYNNYAFDGVSENAAQDPDDSKWFDVEIKWFSSS